MSFRNITSVFIAQLGLVVAYTAYAQSAAPSSAAPSARPSGAPSAAGAAPGGGAGGPVPVEVTKAVLGVATDEVSATGTVKAAESVVLRPEISGRIAKLRFKDGEKVKAGAVLIELDASLAQAEREQAAAELALAQANLKRTEELADKNFVSSRSKDEALSQVKILQAKLTLADARLARSFIKAPFDGVVGLRNISVGDYVKEGADLVTIDDVRRLRVDFKLPERYATTVKVGQKVLVMPDPQLKLKPSGGKIEAIDSILDSNGRALTLRTRIGNKGEQLKPGMFVQARVITAERKDAVLIPDEAMTMQGPQAIVFKAVDGKAVRTPIKIGNRMNGKVEVKEGLAAGDTIVSVGLQRINRPDTPIRVVEGRAPSAAGGKPASAAQ